MRNLKDTNALKKLYLIVRTDYDYCSSVIFSRCCWEYYSFWHSTDRINHSGVSAVSTIVVGESRKLCSRQTRANHRDLSDTDISDAFQRRKSRLRGGARDIVDSSETSDGCLGVRVNVGVDWPFDLSRAR